MQFNFSIARLGASDEYFDLWSKELVALGRKLCEIEIEYFVDIVRTFSFLNVSKFASGEHPFSCSGHLNCARRSHAPS